MAGEINFGLLDSSIPLRAANAFQDGQDTRRKNALAELAYGQAMQQAEDDKAYRQAFTESAGDMNALQRLLGQHGLGKQAMDLQGKLLEQEAKKATIAKDKASAGKSEFELLKGKTDFMLNETASLMANPTYENLAASVQRGVQMGLVTPEEAQQKLANAPRDPAQILAQARQANAQLLSAKDRLPKEVNGQWVDPATVQPIGVAPQDPNKPFQIGQDGKPVANTAYQKYEVGKAHAGAPKTMVNVAANTGAEELTKDLVKRRQPAQASVTSINNAHQVMGLLDSGKVMTGPGTSVVTELAKYMPVGGKDTQEKIANTQVLIAQLAKGTLDNSSFLKGPTSDRDIAFLRDVSAGNINLDERAIRRVAELSEQAHRESLRAFNADATQFTNSVGGKVPYRMTIEEPAPYQRQQPNAGAGGLSSAEQTELERLRAKYNKGK